MQGFITFTAVGVDSQGVVDPAAIQSALSKSTCLITVMHSNNEVGSIQPIQQIAQLAKQHSVLMHSDAAQSIGKVCHAFLHMSHMGVCSVCSANYFSPSSLFDRC